MDPVEMLNEEMGKIRTKVHELATEITVLKTDKAVLQPTCYTRHAEMDGHIKEGKFWRGVIITVTLAAITIFIGQYNMSIENNNKLIALNSKLTTIVEANDTRLAKLEDRVWDK